MKEKSIAIFIIPLVFATCLSAQNASFEMKMDNSLSLVPQLEISTANSNSGTGINNIPAKAIRDFCQSQKNARNIRWFIEARGYFAYFYVDVKKCRTYYDRKGNSVYTLKTYPGQNLPLNILADLRYQELNDYAISWVNEININRDITYVILLENAKTAKYLRISGGEMEVVNSFSKK